MMKYSGVDLVGPPPRTVPIAVTRQVATDRRHINQWLTTLAPGHGSCLSIDVPAAHLHLHGSLVNRLDAESWLVRGVLVQRRRARRSKHRIELDVTMWTTQVAEVVIRPLGRRSVSAWGARKQEEYFQLAHAAADRLAERLRSAACAVPTQLPYRDARVLAVVAS